MARKTAAEKTAAGTRTRTVAYLRVSTDKQADHGVSLAAQRAKVEAYAGLFDLDLVEVIEDAGASAKTLQREGLARALDLLTGGQAEALLVVKLDRLTRSVRDLGDLVEAYFADGRCALMSVGEQVDTRSAAGRLVLNVLMSVAQWEREAIGERTAAAMAHMKACREYTGGSAPYGWTVAADGRTLEACAAEQDIICCALTLRDAGLSLRKVGAELEARGMLPRSGAAWHAKTVRDLLSAEVA